MGLAGQRVRIVNTKGLHARAAAAFSRMASQFDSRITVNHEATSADARSIMDLLLLVGAKDCEIEIMAEGPDAQEAVTALASLVADGFGERDPSPPET